MAQRQSSLSFRLMALEFKLRDWLSPRRAILAETGIEAGMRVLDYGCGPGSYILPVAEMVGEAGRVYALDRHPLAIAGVRRLTARAGLRNVETILSDCKTGLGDGEVDVVLLYDVLHDIHDPGPLLTELHRVLKPEGILSFSDRHMKEEEIVHRLTGDGLFHPARRGRKTYSFSAVKPLPSDRINDERAAE